MSVAKTIWTYTKEQIDLLENLYARNGKSISSALSVAYLCGDTFKDYKSLTGAVELVRFLEKIAAGENWNSMAEKASRSHVSTITLSPAT